MLRGWLVVAVLAVTGCGVGVETPAEGEATEQTASELVPYCKVYRTREACKQAYRSCYWDRYCKPNLE